MKIVISPAIEAKLRDLHKVSPNEVDQCFQNIEGRFLEDTREQHRTDPPTQWFIAPTNHGRMLKVVFVARDDAIYIRTAYEPNPAELRIYSKHGLEGGT